MTLGVPSNLILASGLAPKRLFFATNSLPRPLCPMVRSSASLGRQRDMFPLAYIPEPCKTHARRPTSLLPGTSEHSWAAKRWANSGIATLNGLMGFDGLSGETCIPPACGLAARDHIEASYADFGTPPADLGTPEECYMDIIGSTAVYATDRSDVKPYVKDAMSWPHVGADAVTLTESLPKADRERLRDWQQVLLRPDAEIEQINAARGEAKC